jgi:hypothetical protein
LLHLKGKGFSINNFYISNVGGEDNKQNKPNPLDSLFEIAKIQKPTQNAQTQTQRPVSEYYENQTQRPIQNYQTQTQRPILSYQTSRPMTGYYYETQTQRPIQNIQPSISTPDSGLSGQCLKCICNV